VTCHAPPPSAVVVDTQRVFPVVRRGIGILALTLAACAAPPPALPESQPATTMPSPRASESDSVESSEATASQPPSLQTLLPAELDGVELHTFAVGEDILARLAADIGVSPDQLMTAFASDHGSRFVQIYAIRLPGAPASALAAAWTAVAYPPDVSDVAVRDETIDGRPITVVHSPSASPRLGTFNLDSRGDALIVVQALDSDVASEVLASVP
jgi:hypothetical protein